MNLYKQMHKSMGIGGSRKSGNRVRTVNGAEKLGHWGGGIVDH